MLNDAYFNRFETPKYQNKNPLQRHFIRSFVRAVHSNFIAAGPVERVLEVGVGEGFLSGYLSEKFPEKQFSGVDIDTWSIDRLKSKFPKIEAHVGAIEDLGFLKGQFDLVICCEVLEHVRDPAAALATLESFGARHLILSVPHEPFFILSNLARGKNLARLGNDPEHLHHWTKRSFTKFLESRFDVLSMETPYPWLVGLCRSRQA